MKLSYFSFISVKLYLKLNYDTFFNLVKIFNTKELNKNEPFYFQSAIKILKYDLFSKLFTNLKNSFVVFTGLFFKINKKQRNCLIGNKLLVKIRHTFKVKRKKLKHFVSYIYVK